MALGTAASLPAQPAHGQEPASHPWHAAGRVRSAARRAPLKPAAEPMSAALERAQGAPAALDFLVVDEFIATMVGARALKTAFELGLVDRLLESRSGSVEALGRALGVDAAGLRLLLDMLGANGVVEERAGDVRLTRRFLDALRYRDLLETKLDFAGFSINDFADLF